MKCAVRLPSHHEQFSNMAACTELYMLTCVCTHTHVVVLIRTHASSHSHMSTCVEAHTYTPPHTPTTSRCISIFIPTLAAEDTHSHVQVYMNICSSACMPTCVHTCTLPRAAQVPRVANTFLPPLSSTRDSLTPSLPLPEPVAKPVQENDPTEQQSQTSPDRTVAFPWEQPARVASRTHIQHQKLEKLLQTGSLSFLERGFNNVKPQTLGSV